MISFYDKSTPYFEFSNYYPATVTIDGLSYPSTEHYYQSMKFQKPDASKKSITYSEIIRTSKTANISRELASQKTKGGYKWRTDLNPIILEHKDVVFDAKWWDEVKDNIMRKAIWAKVIQNSKIKNMLLDTGDKKLVEASPRDSYWGWGKDKNGKNMLGKILMEVRYLISGKIIKSPYKRSFWAIPNVLLASAYPGAKNEEEHAQIFPKLTKEGIDTVINLMEHDEKEKYRSYVKSNDMCEMIDGVLYMNIPIKDRNTLPDDYFKELMDGLLYIIGQHRQTLIHCFGGKGRTGTVVCGILCESYGMVGEQAIKIYEKLFENREDKGNVMRLMTKTQKDQIKRLYP